MNKKTVIITGASGGLGRSLVDSFVLAGFHVIAGVRKQEDFDKIVQDFPDGSADPIFLDLSNDEHYDLLRARILKVERLAALVNNAGVTGLGPLEEQSLDEIDLVFNTNVRGVLRLSQMCIPRLRQCGGKIINIGSTSGVIGAPLGSVYAATKFALKGLSEALYRELSPQGIQVIHVIPGAIKTNIWNSMTQKVSAKLRTMAPRAKWSYRGFLDTYKKIEEQIPNYAMDSKEVAALVTKEFLKKNSRRDLVIGGSAKLQVRLSRFLPVALLELILRKRFDSPLHPPKDWSSIKYPVVEKLGEEVDFFFTTIKDEQVDKIYTLNHAVTDGMGAICEILHHHGSEITVQPTLKQIERPGLLRLTKLFFDYAKSSKGPKYQWLDYEKGRAAKRTSDHTLIRFAPDSSMDLYHLAKSKSSGVSGLVVHTLNRAAKQMLLVDGESNVSNWLMPVNFRGAYGETYDLRNRTTSLALSFDANITPSQIDGVVKKQLSEGMPWGSWIHSNAGRVLGEKGLDWVYRNVKPSQFLGVFSNMGVWPNPSLPEDKMPVDIDGLFACAPSVSICPISSAIITWKGSLAISIRVHPDFIAADDAAGQFGGKFVELLEAELGKDLSHEVISFTDESIKGQAQRLC
jgi:short-subunit dehydrogenase